MSTYSVQAKRWARGWELHIFDAQGAEVGVTQSHTIAGAGRMVRDYLALQRDEDPDAVEFTVRAELDAATTAEVEQARKEMRAIEEAQERAAEHWRSIARRLRDSGLTGGDIAAVLDVSPQRVSQLTKAS
ncbi:hypothetical protein ACQPZA_31880 [Pseudonocardia xinjiangensis]|jgi:hypothetical protein|uniref:Sigma-70-like protein n=1 Tax=Pseudonocardia xinjiangensis TaxID=75289 RepID=A0ABX1RBD1_9PSEU|nr:hypothetical protein [Pseudonocardia xinjiangensis]NMH77199.1 hypothetical protein [Pseudonocardia xinjiangensis]